MVIPVNYRYVLDKCAVLVESGRILDYGCGAGEVVEGGLARGLDIVGVEAFYEGGRSRELVVGKGLLGTRIFELADHSRIPFDSEHFDLVISNQVFEHVADLRLTLQEIRRVLKPGGSMLALFPTAEVVREGHCGVPMIHWFSRTSVFRRPYMRLMGAMGFGFFKQERNNATWARDFLAWLDQYTYYRSGTEVQRELSSVGFRTQFIEEDYIAYRLDAKCFLRIADLLRRSAMLHPLVRTCCRRLGGRVILATRL